MLNIYQRLGLAVAGTLVALGNSAIESAQAASFKFSFGAPGSEGSLNFSDSPLTGIGRESATLQELEGANFEYYFNNFNNSPVGFEIFAAYNSQNSSSAPDISFNFDNGQLVGINQLANSASFEYSGSGGSRAWSISGTDYLLTRGDRFVDYFEGRSESGGLVGCSRDDSSEVCTFDNTQENYSSEISATGILLKRDERIEQTLVITDFASQEDRRETTVTSTPFSTFYSFDNSPRQITFTTLEAVPRDPATVPEPSSILGISAAIAGGGWLKRRQKKAKS